MINPIQISGEGLWVRFWALTNGLHRHTMIFFIVKTQFSIPKECQLIHACVNEKYFIFSILKTKQHWYNSVIEELTVNQSDEI